MSLFSITSKKRSSDAASVEKKLKTDTNVAQMIFKQIEEDKQECFSFITKYGVDTNEFLHLLGRWTQNLILKYEQNHELYKTLLREKWEHGELENIITDHNSSQLIYQRLKKLLDWQQTGVTNLKIQFTEAQNTKHANDKLKKLIDELLEIMSTMIVIQEYIVDKNTNDCAQINILLDSLNQTKEHVERMQKINEKECNTICIIGLEKAGKSTFINALLGFKILPSKIERCTQVKTIVKPLVTNDSTLFADVEFYNDDEFKDAIDNLYKKQNETDDDFKQRQTLLCQLQQKTILPNSLTKYYHTSNDNDRRETIKELEIYITDEKYLNIVKHVTFYTNKLPGENYILVDVPGCDSPIVEHRLSAIRVVQDADAFLFLTDGQRPSLTDHQIQLLNEIQHGHFDGMKRAFGIITKLDSCQTQMKYQEHYTKAKLELEQKGFRSEHIFPVATNVTLLEETKGDRTELRQVKTKIQKYGTLLQGFDQCKEKLNYFIEEELPQTRLKQIITITEDKIVSHINDVLRLFQQISSADISTISSDDYIKQLSLNEWNDIFENKRYQPILARASRWQKETLVINRTECQNILTQTFAENFQKFSQSITIQSHLIEHAMLEQHDIAVFQMNSYEVDDKQRKTITFEILRAINKASDHLVIFMYNKYIIELQKIFNAICPEQNNFFQIDLTMEHYAIEVKTLILRVIHPLIIATIRWSHTNYVNRKNAVEDFIRIAPIIAFDIRQSNSEISSHENGSFKKIVNEFLQISSQNTISINQLLSITKH
ncbi:hypothetical protein I4U23_021377 [Adineta vaga]|nr:hypothetical protein I4U23_021377 [Adineta vaga]